ncbi:MAG: pilus assembly protein TadG-related protein [Candidatus Dormibacteria bacterium]
MVLFAISLLVLVVAVGVAVDGGYGLFEYRQAQNAADFASVGAATELLANCGGAGPIMTNYQVAAVLDDLVSKNSPSTAIPGGWTAYYLDSTGNTLTSPPSTNPIYVDTPGTDTPASGNAPIGACGVYVTVTPQWPAFLTQLIGFTKLKTAASAAAVNAITKGDGTLTAIAALGEHGAHTIFEGGSGSFNVTGTIYDNSDGWLTTGKGTWSGSNGEVDVIDGKQAGTMNVQGDILSYVGNPFDHCFSGGDQVHTANTMACDVNTSTKITYLGWEGNQGSGPGGKQQSADPLNTDPGPPPADDAFCGTQSITQSTYSATSGASPIDEGGIETYMPGIYTYPVVVTGNAEFYNCSQELNPTDASSLATQSATAGEYYFEDGVALDPGSGDTVNGTGVLFVTAEPIPDSAGGTYANNTGDGEPPIGNGSGECDLELTYETCGNSYTTSPGPDCNGGEPAPVTLQAAGTNCNAVTDAANSVANQGLNYSLEIGGKGTVNLLCSVGTSFPWTDFVTWQLTPVSGQPIAAANTGLDGELGDTATINLNGIMYNNSVQVGQDLFDTLGESSKYVPQYWDGNAGIPYLPGGMLLAGYGVAGGAYGTGFTCGNVTTGYSGSGCKITLTGLAVTDEFQTEGYSDFTILGSTYKLPGIQGTGAILTQ